VGVHATTVVRSCRSSASRWQANAPSGVDDRVGVVILLAWLTYSANLQEQQQRQQRQRRQQLTHPRSAR